MRLATFLRSLFATAQQVSDFEQFCFAINPNKLFSNQLYFWHGVV
ncbi:hypothetical protein SAMN05444682_103272 [Parapedobacter indicus]|uniref:Uncharacterized protein n=1 Tax=Parapedobacter indicus TaxID=1477437 RepID=A0A1I3H9D2_9SPHI|nr:hypothetical protein CLV26_103273 [Parapedobacter indicus]SFI32345.1 hypothetical protein SAMN05444682_103272 [Parapedobacter indicus]